VLLVVVGPVGFWRRNRPNSPTLDVYDDGDDDVKNFVQKLKFSKIRRHKFSAIYELHF
jgi:hypothetical protein